MRCAAISIPSNIAEGNVRGSKEEYIQFLRIAFASGAELETQFLLVKDLNLIKDEEYTKISPLLSEAMKMLNVLIKKLSI
jgi:four helix bundle protein